MKAYIIPLWSVIEPFKDRACDCLVMNQTVKELQLAVLNSLNIEPIYLDNESAPPDEEEHILFYDNLYLTRELLEEFIRKSRDQNRSTVCALKTGTTTRLTGSSLQNVAIKSDHIEYNLYYFSKGWLMFPCLPIIIDPDELSLSIIMPHHMCGADEYFVPFTDKLIIQIDHWVNLWAANVFSTVAKAARLQKSSKFKQLYLALKAKSLNRWSILKQINKIGSNCDIHPTAYVEGSDIGSNVTIGAGVIIRNSVVGNNVNLGNGVVVEESVIGSGSAILSGHIIYSVLYSSVFSVTPFITASIMGRETFAGAGSVMTDFRFDKKNVPVYQNGKLTDSGNNFLGSCLGHNSYLGAGCVVAPGRSVPNGTKMTMDNSRVAHNFNDVNNIEGFRIINK